MIFSAPRRRMPRFEEKMSQSTARLLRYEPLRSSQNSPPYDPRLVIAMPSKKRVQSYCDCLQLPMVTLSRPTNSLSRIRLTIVLRLRPQVLPATLQLILRHLSHQACRSALQAMIRHLRHHCRQPTAHQEHHLSFQAADLR